MTTCFPRIVGDHIGSTRQPQEESEMGNVVKCDECGEENKEGTDVIFMYFQRCTLCDNCISRAYHGMKERKADREAWDERHKQDG